MCLLFQVKDDYLQILNYNGKKISSSRCKKKYSLSQGSAVDIQNNNVNHNNDNDNDSNANSTNYNLIVNNNINDS